MPSTIVQGLRIWILIELHIIFHCLYSFASIQVKQVLQEGGDTLQPRIHKELLSACQVGAIVVLKIDFEHYISIL